MDPGKQKKRIGIKIGSNVLTDSQGFLDKHRIDDLVREIASIKKQGIEVILISSGAVAAGRSIYKPKIKADAVGLRQMWSSLGQVLLIETYSRLFNEHNLICSQVLVTRDDFRSRDHFRNMKNCFSVLLSNDIIPIALCIFETFQQIEQPALTYQKAPTFFVEWFGDRLSHCSKGAHTACKGVAQLLIEAT